MLGHFVVVYLVALLVCSSIYLHVNFVSQTAILGKPVIVNIPNPKSFQYFPSNAYYT